MSESINNNQFFTTYAETKNWLDLMKIRNYNINLATLEVNVNDTVDLAYKELNELPIKFNKVTSAFYCQHNKLTNLFGTPNTIVGPFACYNNNLTSLKGGPSQVEGDYWCNDNKLITLEGAPEYVGGDFNCHYNDLTTLAHAPKIIGESFKCHHNQLTDLHGAPTRIKVSFLCQNNNLTSLAGAPVSVFSNFICHANPLKSLNGCPTSIGGHIQFDITEGILSNIYKHIKSVNGIILMNTTYNINGLMCIFLIKHINYIELAPITNDNVNAANIINKYLQKSKKSGPACQIELIEAGLSNYAKM